MPGMIRRGGREEAWPVRRRSTMRARCPAPTAPSRSGTDSASYGMRSCRTTSPPITQKARRAMPWRGRYQSAGVPHVTLRDGQALVINGGHVRIC